jgi:hypothetical protein
MRRAGQPDPGRVLNVMSPSTAFIDIVTAEARNGMNLTMQVGKVLGEGAVDHAHHPVGAPESPGCPHTIENGAR